MKNMEKKIIGVFICMLLISSILPVTGVFGNESDNDDETSDGLQFKSSVISEDFVSYSHSSEKDTVEIYEGVEVDILVEASWDPPSERPICLWIDTTSIPDGATVYPNPSSGVDYTSLILTWNPTYCQADTYDLIFNIGEYCYEPIDYLQVTIIVLNVNRPPTMWVDPPGPFEVEPGDTVEVDVFGNDSDAYECGDDYVDFICSDPDHFWEAPDHEFIGGYERLITEDDLGTEIHVTFRLTDSYGDYVEIEITINVPETEEGLHIDSIFEPTQVNYQDDPRYPPDDLTGGPCEYDAALGMVTGKNTYLFGHPYANRNKIDMTCCNNYDVDVEFQWVFKIYPDDKEIWRSETVMVPAHSTKTFTYNTPLPTSPFQWDRWGDAAKTKPGRVELTIDPDLTGGTSPCNCEKVIVNVDLHKTHDLKVLFLPFTFGDGPAFPADMQIPEGGGTAFDTWRWNTLNPWWLAIYPVREGGLTTNRNWLGNLQKNLTTGGKTVSDSASFSALTRAEQLQIWNQMFTASAALAWMRLYDRIVWLLHPDILHLNKAGGGTDYGNGWGFVAAPGANNKYGVLVNWSTRTKTAPHEITHTYGVVDSYPAPSFATGYWVNTNTDIIDRRDLMYYTHPIADSWIKKPNFKSLLDRFTQHRDPIVLGISGYIDTDNNVELNPWYKLDEGNIDLEWDTSGDYLIKAYDSSGDLLETAGFSVSFSIFGENLGEIPIDESAFAFRLEWINGLKRVDIVKAGSDDVLASRTVSSNSPQVTITSPQPNEEIKQEPFEIEWDSSDADGDTLTATVWISNSSGEDWFPVDMDVTGDSTSVDFTDLPKDNYQINVVVTDNINTGEDTVSFEIKKVKSRVINTPFLSFLLSHPNMFPILRFILKI